MFLLPSPVEPLRLAGRTFFVKRDDLIHPDFSGNKYRKLFAFLNLPDETFDTVVSYGGVQSNAMSSIAAMCRLKGWRFHYFSKSVPSYLKTNPSGNHRHALDMGMHLHEIPPADYPARIDSLLSGEYETLGSRVLFVPQGGAAVEAQAGVSLLAEEILHWKREKGIGRLNVVTPSGTGTTAAFLAKALPECRVLTTPAVGDARYLSEQIARLIPLPENLTILATERPFRFGRPDPLLYERYRDLKEAGIEFDLLYAPVMWTALLENLDAVEGELLYVHSGGVGGNGTMEARYLRVKNE